MITISSIPFACAALCTSILFGAGSFGIYKYTINKNTYQLENQDLNTLGEHSAAISSTGLNGSSQAYHRASELMNNAINSAVTDLESEGKKLGWNTDELRIKKVNLIAMMSDKARFRFWDVNERRYKGDLEPKDLTSKYNPNDPRSYIQQLESLDDGSYNKINGHSWEESDVYYGQNGVVLGLELKINGGWENRDNGGETWHRYFD